jgi:hypothetical protein
MSLESCVQHPVLGWDSVMRWIFLRSKLKLNYNYQHMYMKYLL